MKSVAKILRDKKWTINDYCSIMDSFEGVKLETYQDIIKSVCQIMTLSEPDQVEEKFSISRRPLYRSYRYNDSDDDEEQYYDTYDDDLDDIYEDERGRFLEPSPPKIKMHNAASLVHIFQKIPLNYHDTIIDITKEWSKGRYWEEKQFIKILEKLHDIPITNHGIIIKLINECSRQRSWSVEDYVTILDICQDIALDDIETLKKTVSQLEEPYWNGNYYCSVLEFLKNTPKVKHQKIIESLQSVMSLRNSFEKNIRIRSIYSLDEKSPCRSKHYFYEEHDLSQLLTVFAETEAEKHDPIVAIMGQLVQKNWEIRDYVSFIQLIREKLPIEPSVLTRVQQLLTNTNLSSKAYKKLLTYFLRTLLPSTIGYLILCKSV
jgi:hypothetical protein